MKKKLKIGCCGFPVSKEKYFNSFDVVEIQKTFYQPPSLTTVEKWRKEAPEDFEFTLKAWQLITHPPSSPTYRRLKEKIPESLRESYGFFRPTKEVFFAWEETKKIALSLQTKVIVFQCPASFKANKTNIQNLRGFLQHIKDERFVFVWEPRGKWESEIVKSICEEFNLVHGVDPFQQKPVYTGSINYFRLHGKGGYRYKYTDRDLNYLKTLCQETSFTYVMFNNVFMYEDACRFKSLMQI